MTHITALLLHFLQLVIILQAEDRNFVEPLGEFLGVEYYEFDGDRYAIYTQKVTWEEASQLCPVRNGTLIDYETPGLAEFIARALAESAVGFGALWINGKFVKADKALETGEWKWYKSGNPIDVTGSTTQYPMEAAPYWVNAPTNTSKVDLCLGTDRRLHHLPLIVPVDCKQQRPYICKLAQPSDSAITELKPPVETKEKLFHLFQAQVTWAEALAECRTLNMKLAKVVSIDEFTRIGHKMLRVRPVIENAWIGGSFTEDKWTWVATDEPILVDEKGSSDMEKFAWYRPNNIVPEGCLLADRHVCDHFVYVEAKCDRRRPFICEQEISSKHKQPFVMLEENLWVSTFVETWEKAQEICLECFQGHLVHIEPPKKETMDKYLPILYKAMALATGDEIRHIWIGGYLFGEKFFWTKDSKVKADDAKPLDGYDNSTYGIGENGILVYCNVNLTHETYLLKYKCLNMDRENQKNFFMYGLNCYLKQHFICQNNGETTEMLDCAKKKAFAEDVKDKESRQQIAKGG